MSILNEKILSIVDKDIAKVYRTEPEHTPYPIRDIIQTQICRDLKKMVLLLSWRKSKNTSNCYDNSCGNKNRSQPKDA